MHTYQAEGAVVDFTVTAQDAQGASLPVMLSHASGSTFPPGATVIIASATDAEGLTSTGRFTVTVTFTPPGTISFAASTVSVNQGSTSASLSIVRTGPLPATTITINTDDGFATYSPPYAAAVAVTDYVDLVNVPVTFAENEVSKTVTVSLIPKIPANTPNKRFTAALSAPGTGILLGETGVCTVQILANDAINPTASITVPAAAATAVVETWPYLIKGSANDAKGISRIEVSLNGESPVDVAISRTQVTTSVDWSLALEPPNGLMTISVTAFDQRGNSTTVGRSFNFTRAYLLTVSRIVPAAVQAEPSTAGTVTLLLNGRSGVLLPSAVNADPKTIKVIPGTAASLFATARTGYAIVPWAVRPPGSTTDGSRLEFDMPAANCAATVIFVPNPFHPPVGTRADFYGLIKPESGTMRSLQTEGFCTVTMFGQTGGFSGKIQIGGLLHSFRGTAFGDGSMYFNSGSGATSKLIFGSRALSLSYNAGAGNDRLTMTLVDSADGSRSSGYADRGAYTASNPVSATYPELIRETGPALNYSRLAACFASKAQVPPMAASRYPQGDGYATVGLRNDGTVLVSGSLADGTSISFLGVIVIGNRCPFYIPLTTPGSSPSVSGGTLMGEIIIDPSQPDSDASGPDIRWYRPAVTEVSGTSALALATQRYSAGWPEGISVDLVGAFHDANTDLKTTLGLGDVNASVGNGRLTFSDGKLASPLVIDAFNATPSANGTTTTVTKIPVNNPAFTLLFVQSDGGFSGTFTPTWASPATAKPSFRGMVINKGANKGGFGYFISNAVGDRDQESGGVTLSKRP